MRLNNKYQLLSQADLTGSDHMFHFSSFLGKKDASVNAETPVKHNNIVYSFESNATSIDKAAWNFDFRKLSVRQNYSNETFSATSTEDIEFQTKMASDPATQSRKFLIIWLDRHNDGPTNKNRFKHFRVLDAEFLPLTTPEDCEATIVREKKLSPLISIIIIISGAFSQENIPKFQNETCVIAFFIYCRDAERYTDLKYSKLRGVYDDTLTIVDGIQILFYRTGDTTDFSTFPAAPVTPSDGNEVKETGSESN